MSAKIWVGLGAVALLGLGLWMAKDWGRNPLAGRISDAPSASQTPNGFDSAWFKDNPNSTEAGATAAPQVASNAGGTGAGLDAAGNFSPNSQSMSRVQDCLNRQGHPMEPSKPGDYQILSKALESCPDTQAWSVEEIMYAAEMHKMGDPIKNKAKVDALLNEFENKALAQKVPACDALSMMADFPDQNRLTKWALSCIESGAKDSQFAVQDAYDALRFEADQETALGYEVAIRKRFPTFAVTPATEAPEKK